MDIGWIGTRIRAGAGRGEGACFSESILFIGPMGVGKTSAAKQVASILGMDYVDVDAQRWDYFSRQPDYDARIVDRLFSESRGIEAFSYMKPFEARYAVDILASNAHRVFDFGAGYSVYQSAELFEQVKAAFSKYKNVVFLRYSSDTAESLEALRERHADVPKELYDALNKEFIESPCNQALATHVIDTKGKSTHEVAELVLKLIYSNPTNHCPNGES